MFFWGRKEYQFVGLICVCAKKLAVMGCPMSSICPRVSVKGCSSGSVEVSISGWAGARSGRIFDTMASKLITTVSNSLEIEERKLSKEANLSFLPFHQRGTLTKVIPRVWAATSFVSSDESCWFGKELSWFCGWRRRKGGRGERFVLGRKEAWLNKPRIWMQAWRLEGKSRPPDYGRSRDT